MSHLHHYFTQCSLFSSILELMGVEISSPSPTPFLPLLIWRLLRKEQKATEGEGLVQIHIAGSRQILAPRHPVHV